MKKIWSGTGIHGTVVPAALGAILIVLTSAPAGAQLVGELGILDLDANGGNNPATGAPWQAGDTYRFAFTSSGITPATSTNIDYYNTFVQDLANASPLGIGASNGVTWKAIASTAEVDARDNTSTHVASNGTGEAIFLLNGTTILATDYERFWTFRGFIGRLNLTELLTTPPNNLPGGTQWGTSWTGTDRIGYPGANYGTADSSGDGPLGDPDGRAMAGLWQGWDMHWVWRWGNFTTNSFPIYGLSEPLTVRGVSISKTVSATEVSLDQGPTNLIYTIELANSLTSAFGGVVVTDALPPEVSFVSANPPADITNGNEYVFNVGLLGAETSLIFTVVGSVIALTPGVATNVASFGMTNTNAVASAYFDTAETLLYRPADLEVIKSSFVFGSNVQYTVVVTNLGQGDATGVMLTDTLPAVLDFQTSTPTAASVVGNDYTFNLGTVAAGAATSIVISAVYTSPASILITNTAFATTTWFEDELSNNTDSVVSPAGGALVLLKTVSDPTVNLDLGVTNLIYTLQVLNSFTVPVSSVTVTDTLPGEVSFVSAFPPATVTNGNEYGFDLGGLPPGSNAVISITVLATSTVPAMITNVAIASAAETNLTGVVGDSAQTLLYRPTDLALTKTAGIAGTNVTYTLTVTNLSVSDATGVTLVDTFPPELTYVSASPSPNSIVGNTYTFDLGTVAAGAGTSVTMFAYSTSAVPIMVTNDASVTTTYFEDALANNTDRVVSVVSGGLDLSLTKSVSTTNLSVGTNLTYTLDIVNNSTGAVPGVTVTDSLPAVVTFLSSQPPVVPVGQDVIFNIGNLAGGASTTLVIEVSTETLIAGAITNVAHVATTAGDINPANDMDTAVTQIPDTDGDGDANPGDPDDDNDGMADEAEQIAGTEQLNEFSYLWLRIARGSNEWIRQLTWPGVTGRTYRVQSSTNILVDGWGNAQTNIPGPPLSNELMSVSRTNPAVRVYYRIGVERP